MQTSSVIVLPLVSLFGIASLNAASLYIGDAASEGLGVVDGNAGPDGAGFPGPGQVTYGFYASGYTNATGGAQQLQITEANFWGRIAGTGVTPFVATFSGTADPAGGQVGANYNVLSRGDSIVSAVGLNNGLFLQGGVSPVVTLNAGDTLVSGFYQDGQVVPWLNADGSVGDYLDEGNEIPASGALTENAEWSNLARNYRFNVGLEVVPEPSTSLFLLPALAGFLFFRRRR